MSIQRTTGRSRQRGLSFIGVIFMGLMAVAVFAIGGQSLPIFLERQAIAKAMNKAKLEGTVPEVRAAFDRAATIDDIKSVKGEDLEVTKRGDNRVVVSAKYAREIALVGPAHLVYRFQVQTD